MTRAGRLAILLMLPAIAGCGGGQPSTRSLGPHAGATPVRRVTSERTRRAYPAHPPFAVGVRRITFVDRSRVIRPAGYPPRPRTLATVIRYPAAGPPGRGEVPSAPKARNTGPLPLVVFGHGFALTPAPYAALLRAWASAGYIVAAPSFPLENAGAPGGPDETDLLNQPRDVSLVITRLLALSRARTGPLAGVIDPRRIAVAGHSDGGETALAVAYDPSFRDHRVRATVILSGAQIPGTGGFTFPRHSPPLLLTQGTADMVNPPSFTRAVFDRARSPKYLLTLFGADHLGPYTREQPQLAVVERATIAFLDAYLRGDPGGRSRLARAGEVPGVSAVNPG